MGRIYQNAKRILQSPDMMVQFGRWCACRALGIEGPSVRCAGGNKKLSIWLDFSDFWWNRAVAKVDAAGFLFMRRLVEENTAGSVAVDVGANTGLFCLMMAEAGFTRIHAFEPDPTTFTRLARHVRANGLKNITLNCMAAGDTYGVVPFDISGSPGLHHVSVEQQQGGRSVLQVPTVPLDDYCARSGIDRVAFAKIDVEGFEPWVLRGMRNLLMAKRVGALMIEVAPLNLAQTGSSIEQLAAPFAEAGYAIRELLDDGTAGKVLCVADMNAVREMPLPSINVVCLPGK